MDVARSAAAPGRRSGALTSRVTSGRRFDYKAATHAPKAANGAKPQPPRSGSRQAAAMKRERERRQSRASASPRVEPRGSISRYQIGETIGEGTFGKVKKGTHVLTGTPVAIKILEKSRIKDASDLRRVEREIFILKRVNHPHVVRLYEVIESDEALFLIMEYANGGELFDYIVARQRVQELDACFFFHQLLNGIDYCHKRNIIHRDLKPENLLIHATRDSRTLKIVDFGLGNAFRQGELCLTACGSPCYAAPEMVAGLAYEGPASDLWSCGVVLFALLCGYLPFEDANTARLYEKIMGGEYEIPEWVSPGAAHLLQRLLTVDPAKRIRAEEVRRHPWYRQVDHASDPPGGVITVPTKETLYVEQDIVEHMARLGFAAADVLDSLRLDKHDEAAATYFFLELYKKRALETQSGGESRPRLPGEPDASPALAASSSSGAAAITHPNASGDGAAAATKTTSVDGSPSPSASPQPPTTATPSPAVSSSDAPPLAVAEPPLPQAEAFASATAAVVPRLRSLTRLAKQAAAEDEGLVEGREHKGDAKNGEDEHDAASAQRVDVAPGVALVPTASDASVPGSTTPARPAEAKTPHPPASHRPRPPARPRPPTGQAAWRRRSLRAAEAPTEPPMQLSARRASRTARVAAASRRHTKTRPAEPEAAVPASPTTDDAAGSAAAAAIVAPSSSAAAAADTSQRSTGAATARATADQPRPKPTKRLSLEAPPTEPVATRTTTARRSSKRQSLPLAASPLRVLVPSGADDVKNSQPLTARTSWRPQRARAAASPPSSRRSQRRATATPIAPLSLALVGVHSGAPTPARLTPASPAPDGPRERPRARTAFNVSTTTRMPLAQIIAEVKRASAALGVHAEAASEESNIVHCRAGPIQFTLSIVRPSGGDPDTHVVLARNLRGDSWLYQELCHRLLPELRL